MINGLLLIGLLISFTFFGHAFSLVLCCFSLCYLGREGIVSCRLKVIMMGRRLCGDPTFLSSSQRTEKDKGNFAFLQF